MTQGRALSIVAVAFALSGSAFATALNSLGGVNLHSVSRNEWVQSEVRGRDSIDGDVRLREIPADKAKVDEKGMGLSLSLDELTAYHVEAKKLGAAIKAGKLKGETDEAFKARLGTIRKEVGKVAAPIVKSIVKQTGMFGADVVYSRGTEDKLLLIFVKAEKDTEGNVKPKIIASLGLQLEIKEGKVVSFGPIPPRD